MKIAFISSEIWSSYNPEGIVARKILKGFVELGHEVDVITTKELDFLNVTVFSNNIPELIDKIFKNIIGLEKLIFVIKTYNYLKSFSNDYDLIITRSEPVSLHLINLWLNTSAKKISMFSDVGYLNPYYGKYHFLKKIVSFILERSLIKNIDLISHTNSFVVQKYINAGFSESKLCVFPNPLEIDNFTEIKKREKNSKIHLAYTGSLYGDRNPEKLFTYLAEQEDKNFKLYLIGAVRNMYYEKGRFGKTINYLKDKELNTLSRQINYFGLTNNVEILPFMNKQDLVLFIYSNVDVLINIDAFSEVNLFLSSKIVDYLQYKLPILNVSTQGASVDFLEKLGVKEYMDYEKDFRFSLREIRDSGLFLPNYEMINKFLAKNLCEEMINNLFNLKRK